GRGARGGFEAQVGDEERPPVLSIVHLVMRAELDVAEIGAVHRGERLGRVGYADVARGGGVGAVDVGDLAFDLEAVGYAVTQADRWRQDVAVDFRNVERPDIERRDDAEAADGDARRS